MALIGWQNAVEAAGTALSAGSEAAGYPVQMLGIPIGAPSVAWQTAAGVTSSHILIVPPAPVDWRVVALTRTNLTSAATIRVRIGSVANITSAPDYDGTVVSAGVVAGIGQALHILPGAVTAAACRIDIADASNPDGVLNIPLAYAGPATEFNISPQSQPTLEPRRQDVTTRGGQVFTDPLSRARSWGITVGFIRESAIAFLDPLEAAAASGANILFVPRQSSARASAESILGLMTSGPRGFLGPTGNFRAWSATITERL